MAMGIRDFGGTNMSKAKRAKCVDDQDLDQITEEMDDVEDEEGKNKLRWVRLLRSKCVRCSCSPCPSAGSTAVLL